MKVLKGYTKNQYRPEASNVGRYVVEESIEFCSQYIEIVQSVGLPETCHDRTQGGKGTRGYNVEKMTRQEVSQVHLCILNNAQGVLPYIRTHKEYLTAIHPKMNMMKVLE